MTDFPSVGSLPLFVSTFSQFGPKRGLDAMGASAGSNIASLTWPVANTAFYIPVWIPWPYLVNRVFWVNGTSVTSTNMDFGIYTASGTRIYSTGSTAASGASVPQYTSPTPFILTPGQYYFALADSSTTANRGGMGSTTTPTVPRGRLMGFVQEASALPLPATMTPAVYANACMPLCGVTRTASGF